MSWLLPLAYGYIILGILWFVFTYLLRRIGVIEWEFGINYHLWGGLFPILCGLSLGALHLRQFFSGRRNYGDQM